MSKKLLLLLMICSTIIVTLAACASAGSGTQGSSANNAGAKNAVHMNDSNFVQSSITVKKGESITLVDDTSTPHIIANGTWENGTAKPSKEPGTPQVKDVQINGNGSETIGPFATGGTFKLYCTIHPNMNLTVVVQ